MIKGKHGACGDSGQQWRGKDATTCNVARRKSKTTTLRTCHRPVARGSLPIFEPGSGRICPVHRSPCRPQPPLESSDPASQRLVWKLLIGLTEDGLDHVFLERCSDHDLPDVFRREFCAFCPVPDRARHLVCGLATRWLQLCEHCIPVISSTVAGSEAFRYALNGGIPTDPPLQIPAIKRSSGTCDRRSTLREVPLHSGVAVHDRTTMRA